MNNALATGTKLALAVIGLATIVALAERSGGVAEIGRTVFGGSGNLLAIVLGNNRPTRDF